MTNIFQNALHVFSKIDAQDNSIPKAELNSAQLGNIISGVLIVAAVACVIFIIIGAIEYIISRGDSSKIQRAKDSIFYALVGLAVTAFAFAIVQFVVGIFK